MERKYLDLSLLKSDLTKLIKSLNTNNPYSVYNIFCHHINDGENLSPDAIMEKILNEGIKCSYSTISRTLTYMGTSSDFDIKRILTYSYVAKNPNIRDVVILAIPKYIKLAPNQIVDFSTPEGDQYRWKKRCYSLLDQIKDPYQPLPTFFNLAAMKIDTINNKYVLIDNEQHLGRIKERTRQPIIAKIKNMIIELKHENPQEQTEENCLE